jgi:glycosyltransferase involved in cell wall biosynthesis
MNNIKPKISIGLPVFNAEKLLEKRIKSILNQTCKDFELIISDNASTDKTYEICKKIEKTDYRIKLFKQEKNMGPYWNFNFVLQKAEGEFFVWFAADDEHEGTFLEKNLMELEVNQNVVASISNVEYFGKNLEKIIKKGLFQNIKNIFKYRFDKKTKFIQVFPSNGIFEKRATTYLRMDRSTALYSLFRSSIIKKSMIVTAFAGSDLAIILNVLKYGQIHVIDEILMRKSLDGYSSKGIISYLKNQNTKLFGMVFMNMPFTIWCARNLGFKIFIKNLDWFIVINAYGTYLTISDIIQIISNRNSKNK